MQYNYEWGSFNYATGTFKLESYSNYTINSDGQYVFTSEHFAITKNTGGAASYNDYSAGTTLTFWNASNPNVQTHVRTSSLTFHASDFFQSNSDTIQMTEVVNAGHSMSGVTNANGNTVIDWKNIAELVLTVAGS